MTRPGAYNILFEAVPISPVTAPNRFFQVPHCNGMARNYPSAMATIRGIMAQGGWGVVCTATSTTPAPTRGSSDCGKNATSRTWPSSRPMKSWTTICHAVESSCSTMITTTWGGVVAERLADHGCAVTFVTPAPIVSAFTQITAEHGRVLRRMLRLYVAVILGKRLALVEPGYVHLACVHTGLEQAMELDALVLVTKRAPRFARTLSTDLTDEVPFRRERVELDLHQSLPPASAPGAASRAQLSLDGFARR